MRIHWWNLRKNVTADGARLPPETLVQLQSEHHSEAPEGYEVYELVPKFLHALRGYKPSFVTSFEAVPEHEGLSSRSNPRWELPAPKNQAGEATFWPRVLLSPHPGNRVSSPLIRSGYLFIDRLTRKRGSTASLKPEVEVPQAKVRVGEASREAG
jgi:hypothetical protein